MATIPTGVQVDVVFKVESTNGTAATGGAATGEYLRRVTFDLDQDKDSYESDEIIKTYQVSDMRHGMKKVGGTLNGRLAPGAYSQFIAANLRRAFTTGVTLTAIDLAAVSATGFTSVAAAFLSTGFKVGSVIETSGWTGANVGNVGRRYLVTSVVAGTMNVLNLDGTAATIAADAAGESVTINEVGKKTFIPSSGHTNLAYTMEKLYGTATPISELYVGCKINTIDFQLPSTGLAGINFGIMGMQRVTPLGTSAYFTSPTAANANGLLAAVNGVLLYQGAVIGLVTALNFKTDGGMTTGSVVGSNVTPDVFVGKVKVAGQLEAYLTDPTFIAAFDAETEVSIIGVFTVSGAAASDFISFSMPRCKLGGAKKSDGEGPVVITAPFTALYNSNGGTGTSSEQTTIVVQDSDAP
jgi:hypothetical protein